MTRPVALVTGGRRGIGLAVAQRLAVAGFDLIVTDLLPDEGGVAAALRMHGGAVTFLTGDLGDLAVHAAWIDAVRQGAGRIDCLVNNAGMGAVVRGDLLDLTPANFDRVMAVNLRGTAFLTQAALKLMLAQPPGPVPRSVVTITSISATHASPERLDYCVSKAALAMWCKGLAVRFAKDGIGVFDVRPGLIRSDMTAAVAAKYDRMIADGVVPAGRWGEGADVAEVVASLASGAFAYATGSVIDVDGGLAIERF